MVSIPEYVSFAKSSILELLAQEGAATWFEIEAKIADRTWGSVPVPVAPHLLTIARRQLASDGLIDEEAAPTRGGRQVTLLFRQGSRPRRVLDVAARKRLLHGRFLSWGSETAKRPNVLGRGGEVVAHASLLAASPTGFQPINSVSGTIDQIFGEPVPGGSLDNGAHLALLDPAARSAEVVTVLIEVKNVRHWIYPNDWEPFQLLDKAARLQLKHSDRRLVPVFICRRAHYWTFRMARDLGFFVVDTCSQFVLPHSSVRQAHLEEVRDELGYDLTLTAGASQSIVRRLSGPLRDHALSVAERFESVASRASDYFAALRSPSLDAAERNGYLDQLAEAVSDESARGGWRPIVESEPDWIDPGGDSFEP